MNMLIGVLCEVVSAVAVCEKEQMAVEFVHAKLKGVMKDIDENSDGYISKDEFRMILESKEAVRTLDEVGVDTTKLVDCADWIFSVDPDEPNENQTLAFDEFME